MPFLGPDRHKLQSLPQCRIHYSPNKKKKSRKDFFSAILEWLIWVFTGFNGERTKGVAFTSPIFFVEKCLCRKLFSTKKKIGVALRSSGQVSRFDIDYGMSIYSQLYNYFIQGLGLRLAVRRECHC